MTKEEIYEKLKDHANYCIKDSNISQVESRAFLGIYNCLNINAFNIAFGHIVKEYCTEAISYLNEIGDKEAKRKAKLLCEAMRYYDELCAEKVTLVY